MHEGFMWLLRDHEIAGALRARENVTTNTRGGRIEVRRILQVEVVVGAGPTEVRFSQTLDFDSLQDLLNWTADEYVVPGGPDGEPAFAAGWAPVGLQERELERVSQWFDGAGGDHRIRLGPSSGPVHTGRVVRAVRKSWGGVSERFVLLLDESTSPADFVAKWRGHWRLVGVTRFRCESELGPVAVSLNTVWAARAAGNAQRWADLVLMGNRAAAREAITVVPGPDARQGVDAESAPGHLAPGPFASAGTGSGATTVAGSQPWSLYGARGILFGEHSADEVLVLCVAADEQHARDQATAFFKDVAEGRGQAVAQWIEVCETNDPRPSDGGVIFEVRRPVRLSFAAYLSDYVCNWHPSHCAGATR